MASRLVESARPPKLARGMALVLDRDLEIRRRMIHRWNREMTSCRSVYSVGQKIQTGSTPALGAGSINENENETIFIITLPKMIPMT